MASFCAYLEARGELAPGEKGLGRLMAGAYFNMTKSPSFWLGGSAVPYSLSAKPKIGHLFLHVPPGADESTPVLLLLHGYGGNLLYFPWAIWKEMPDCVLIAPSWQIDWCEGSFAKRNAYVAEALRCASEKAGIAFGKPWLVPLSQGGPFAFQLAGGAASMFKGLLGISTYAGDSNLAKIPKRFPVRLLHGDEDTRVSCANAYDSMREIQRRGGDAECTVVKGADHFLVLARRDTVGKFVHESIHRSAVGK